MTIEKQQEATQVFENYFVKNYPGPNTVIYDPKWHAPKIFRAALNASGLSLIETEELEQLRADSW